MNYSSYLLIDYGLPLLGALITALAQLFINRSYNKYRLVETKKKMTGAEVARAILDANGLNNVNVRKVSGKLTDHYDPKYKVIKLSRDCSLSLLVNLSAKLKLSLTISKVEALFPNNLALVNKAKDSISTPRTEYLDTLSL